MLYDVEQVASKLNVSKQTIYNKLKLKEYKDKIVVKQGKSMFDEDLINLIKDNLRGKSNLDESLLDNLNNKELESSIDAYSSILDIDLLNFNQNIIKDLQHDKDLLFNMIQEKDKQIQEKDLIIKELTENLSKALDKANELHQNTQVLFKQHQEQPNDNLLLDQHFQELDLKLNEVREQMALRKDNYDKKFMKRGLLNNLFKK